MSTVSLKRRVESVVEELDSAMGNLRASIHGIPIRQGSFRTQHDGLARDVGSVLVQLETMVARLSSKEN